MKKFLPYIERYVHWAVLGLGAVYVLYMVYAYVITPPVSATVGNKTVDLGNVDKVTHDGPARDLENAINNGATVDWDKIKVQAPLPKFVAAIGNADEKVAALNVAAINAPTAPPPGYVAPNQPNGAPPTGVASGNNNNQALPGNATGQPPQVKDFAPPAANFVNLVAGRSAVTPPPQPANPPGGATAAGQPAPAVQPIQPIQPIQNVQPQGGPGAVAVNPNNPNNLPTVDKNWVSIHYKIPAAAFADSFKKAGVPAVRNQTSFLRVELVRQEEMRDGKWGNETVVQPLQLAFLDAPVWPIPPVPDQQQQETNVQAYITWAQTHAQAILQPVFYTVVKGDVPGVPGDPMQHVGIPQVAQKPFDPAHPGPGPYTPEQTAAIKQYQIQKAQQLRQARPAPGARPSIRPIPGRGGPGGVGGGDGANFAPQDPDRPATLSYQVRTPVRGPGYGPQPTDIAPEDMGDMAGPGGGVGIVQQQNNPALQALAQTIPNVSPFDPSALQVDIDVLAYDENAQPGKRYRYQMRYYVLNPVYGAQALVADPAFAQKFALASDPSVWSPPVEIQPTVSFFLAGGAVGGGETARVDIYRWQNGDVNKTSQNVVPGDRIGMIGKDGIDYTTPWTVVDVRSGNGDKYVLLQTDDGMSTKRESKTDAQNQVKKDLDTQYNAVQQAAAAAAAATRPTTPGATPGFIR